MSFKAIYILHDYMDFEAQEPVGLDGGCNVSAIEVGEIKVIPQLHNGKNVVTVDSRKFRHPNYSAPLRELIVICSKVQQASQIFQLKVPKYFDSW